MVLQLAFLAKQDTTTGTVVGNRVGSVALLNVGWVEEGCALTVGDAVGAAVCGNVGDRVGPAVCSNAMRDGGLEGDAEFLLVG